MGRYKDLKELRGKRGLGRKARKQADPQLPPQVLEGEAESPIPKVKSKIGGRIKQRARKKAARMAMLKAVQRKRSKRRAVKTDELKTSGDGSDQTSGDEASIGRSTLQPFSDENQSWLIPAQSAAKKEGKARSKKSVSFKKSDLLEGGSDGNSSEEEEKGTCKSQPRRCLCLD